jgi:hypothetical protein
MRHRSDRCGLGFELAGGCGAAGLESRTRVLLEGFAAGEERKLR